jgi:hypothetical protein
MKLKVFHITADFFNLMQYSHLLIFHLVRVLKLMSVINLKTQLRENLNRLVAALSRLPGPGTGALRLLKSVCALRCCVEAPGQGR